MHRFFIPSESLKAQDVVLGPSFAHRLGRVLRLQPGDQVIFLDDSGWEYESQLMRLSRDRVEARVLSKAPASGEASLCLHLYQALLKADKFEFVLQKGTELGVASFTPVVTLHSIADAPTPARRERWHRVIREAAEQCRRGRIPILKPTLTLENAVLSASGWCLLPWEEEHALGLHQALMRENVLDTLPEVSLFIGPEGGWAEEEVAMAQQQGVVLVSLGPRILRAETAGLVTASAILYHYGQLGG